MSPIRVNWVLLPETSFITWSVFIYMEMVIHHHGNAQAHPKQPCAVSFSSCLCLLYSAYILLHVAHEKQVHIFRHNTHVSTYIDTTISTLPRVLFHVQICRYKHAQTHTHACGQRCRNITPQYTDIYIYTNAHVLCLGTFFSFLAMSCYTLQQAVSIFIRN